MIVDKFIVHVLDTNMDKPMIADFVGKNFFDVDKFLKKLVKKQMKSDETMKALWKDDEGVVKLCCEAILEEENSFVSCSKEIASYYYDLMVKRNHSKSVTLVIVQFTDNGSKYLAIIKLESKPTYNTDINLINGKFNINIIENTKTLSTSLKQCAVVPEKDLVCLYDLTVLDKEDEKQSIFINNFLNIEPIRDDAYKTKTFIDLASMYIDVNIKDMNEKENTVKLLHYMLDRTSNMDINKFLSMSKISSDLEATLDKYDIKNGFNIDKKVVDKEFKSRSIVTDTGFTIKGKMTAFEDESKYKLVTNDDGTTDLVVKNIKYFKEG